MIQLNHWMKKGEVRNFVSDILLSKSSLERGIYKRTAIEDMINNHQGGKRIASSGTVVSPMHGSLLEVNVNIGENVVEGQLLAVLEAMKMHYEIRAEISGQVEAVFSQKGDQISADDVLLEIKDR